MRRRLSRLLMGGGVGVCAGLLAAWFSPLRGADWFVPLLVLGPAGATLVLLFQLLREEGAGPAAVAGFISVLGAFLGASLGSNWLEPLGLISAETLQTFGYVYAAWGGLVSAALVLVLPRTAVGVTMLAAMLVSGSVLLAALAVLCLVWIGVRAWARGGY